VGPRPEVEPRLPARRGALHEDAPGADHARPEPGRGTSWPWTTRSSSSIPSPTCASRGSGPHDKEDRGPAGLPVARAAS
jgi:hypothetical protein